MAICSCTLALGILNSNRWVDNLFVVLSALLLLGLLFLLWSIILGRQNHHINSSIVEILLVNYLILFNFSSVFHRNFIIILLLWGENWWNRLSGDWRGWLAHRQHCWHINLRDKRSRCPLLLLKELWLFFVFNLWLAVIAETGELLSDFICRSYSDVHVLAVGWRQFCILFQLVEKTRRFFYERAELMRWDVAVYVFRWHYSMLGLVVRDLRRGALSVTVSASYWRADSVNFGEVHPCRGLYYKTFERGVALLVDGFQGNRVNFELFTIISVLNFLVTLRSERLDRRLGKHYWLTKNVLITLIEVYLRCRECYGSWLLDLNIFQAAVHEIFLIPKALYWIVSLSIFSIFVFIKGFEELRSKLLLIHNFIASDIFVGSEELVRFVCKNLVIWSHGKGGKPNLLQINCRARLAL